MALLLHATVEAVQAQPLGQVVDREWSRARLGAALGVVGHPQMVLRVESSGIFTPDDEVAAA
jgi:hypothetical protein